MRSRGFTLIELLVVLALLGVLAVAVVPLAQLSVQREREQELRRSLWEIRDAIDAYRKAKAAASRNVVSGPADCPPNLEALVDGIQDPLQPGQRLRFLRRIPRDPFDLGPVQEPPRWGLRSYQSSADHPEPGAEVYDVYSLSPAIGLNGTPLARW